MFQAFKMAMKSIAGNKMRAALTMLGIIIGVMTLVVLVSLVSGTTGMITDTIASLGNDLLTVNVIQKSPEIDLDLLQKWAQDDAVGAVTAASQTSLTGKYQGSSTSMTVYGTTPEYYSAQGLELILGRYLKNADIRNESYVCVISEGAAEKLIGYSDCLGHEISIGGIRFTVVGILADDEDSLTAVFTGGSAVAYIPYTTLPKITEGVNKAVTTFYVSAAAGYELDSAQKVIEDRLLEHFDGNDDAYNAASMAIIEEAMGDVNAVLELLLGGIAAISLVVGGIGIMNIMLVTVTERTREIGIRKAIGASRGRILLQFLMEAVVMSLLGCAIGIFLSWALLQILSTVLSGAGLVFTLDPGVVTTSVVFCVVIGLIFGLYPANKAAKMPPIEALRYSG